MGSNSCARDGLEDWQKKDVRRNPHLFYPFIKDMVLQVVHIGEEVLQEGEVLGTAGVCL